jgi:hypothetical protein
VRAEIHGPDGRHIILDVKGDDPGALVEHAETLWRLIDGPPAPGRAIGFSTACDAPDPADIDGLTQPDIQLRSNQ